MKTFIKIYIEIISNRYSVYILIAMILAINRMHLQQVSHDFSLHFMHLVYLRMSFLLLFRSIRLIDIQLRHQLTWITWITLLATSLYD